MPPPEPSWVDLVDVAPDDRVLLVDGAGLRAEAALRRIGSDVTVTTDPTRLAGGPWDLVCLDGVDLAAVPQELWGRALGPASRVVVVGDHRASPLRLGDAVVRRGRTAGPGLGRRRTLRRLAAANLSVHQVFGLLRSSAAPVVAFDALAGSSKAAVLDATVAHVSGWRGSAVAVLTRMTAAQVLAVCPGWLVVAGVAGAPRPDRVVGKVGNRDSDEIKLLRGEPVAQLERRYPVSAAGSEVCALRELEEVGFSRSPRLVGEQTDRSCTVSWLPGTTLPLDRMQQDELVAWTQRAAALLAEVQRLTGHPDGTVLVHGDFWLGNLLTRRDEISGVVDWAGAYRGPGTIDREFLVSSLERWIPDDALRARLEDARDQAFSDS